VHYFYVLLLCSRNFQDPISSRHAATDGLVNNEHVVAVLLD